MVEIERKMQIKKKCFNINLFFRFVQRKMYFEQTLVLNLHFEYKNRLHFFQNSLFNGFADFLPANSCSLYENETYKVWLKRNRINVVKTSIFLLFTILFGQKLCLCHHVLDALWNFHMISFVQRKTYFWTNAEVNESAILNKDHLQFFQNSLLMVSPIFYHRSHVVHIKTRNTKCDYKETRLMS